MSNAIGSLDALKATDPDVYAAIIAEEERQRDRLLLIASENFASSAVLAAQGSIMTNKYAEGYPGKRYYGGCQHVDTVEDLALLTRRLRFSPDCVACPRRCPFAAPRDTTTFAAGPYAESVTAHRCGRRAI